MKKKIILMDLLILGILLLNTSIAFAEPTKTDIQEEIDGFVYTISSQGLNKQTLSDIIAKYQELSKTYKNDEIADMLEKSKEALKQENIESEHIDNINKLLRNFETEDLNKIINTMDIDTALSEMSSGSTILDLVKKSTSNMSTTQKAGLFASIVLSSKIVHTVITVIIILGVYQLFTRCVIYKKAHRKPWAVLVPIYRDIVMLRICGMSSWWLLLLLVPIVGWFVLWLVYVASRFMLAEGFGKGEWFGIGLWLLWPIFESILVFSKKTKYIGFEEQ